MTLVLADVESACDSLSKSLLDLYTTFVANPATVSPTATNIIQGLTTATPSTLGRIVGFDNVQEALGLLTAVNTSAITIGNQLASTTQLAGWFPAYVPAMDALETLTGGFAAYLAANSLQISGFLASAFNYYVTMARALGLRGAGYIVNPVLPANSFVPVLQTLATYTVAAGTPFASVGAVDRTHYAPAELGVVVFPGGVGTPSSGATAEQQTITYLPDTGGTPQTVVVTPTFAAQHPGTVVDLGVRGVSVSGVSLGTSANDNGYVYSYVAQPLRNILTY